MMDISSIFIGNKEAIEVKIGGGVFYKKNTELYKPLEYISTNRLQRVVTDYYPNPNTVLEMDIKMSGYQNVTCPYLIFSNNTSSPWGSFTINFGGDNNSGNYGSSYNRLFVWNNLSYDNGASITSYDVPKEIIQNRNKLCITKTKATYGYVSWSLTTKTTTNRTPLILFGNENQSFTTYYVSIYGIKISENGNVVRDFQPVLRTTDNKAGLYDAINDVFYESNGSPFNAGPEKQEDLFEELSWAGPITSDCSFTITLPVTIGTTPSWKFHYNMYTQSNVSLFDVEDNTNYGVNPDSGHYIRYKSKTSWRDSTALPSALNTPYEFFLGRNSYVINKNTSAKNTRDFPASEDTDDGTAQRYNHMILFKPIKSSFKTWGMKIGRVQQFSDDTGTNPVCDLRPVRRVSDGEIGYLCLITNQFITKVGTGVLAAGPITGIRYRKNNNNQYVAI